MAPELFLKAQTIVRERSRKFTNDELLDQLRTPLKREARLPGLIDESGSTDTLAGGIASKRYAADVRSVAW